MDQAYRDCIRWSPALVGFFGFGGVGVGFGFGHIGWVPLAPYELFHPWWGRGFYGRAGAFGLVNGSVVATYRNARIANGISGVRAEDFQAGRFGGVTRYSGAQVGTAGMVTGRMPISPTSANLRFSDRAAANVPRGGAAAAGNHFFTHQQVSGAQRIPFAQQQRGFESTARSGAAGGTMGGSNGGSRGMAAPGASSTGGGAGQWRSFGSASQSPGAYRGNAGAVGGPGGGYRGGNEATRQSPRPTTGYAGGERQGSAGGPQSVRIAPQVARERSTAPSYSAPRQQSTPSYSAPRQSAPSYSAPRSSGGGGGGGGHPSGGGGHSGGGGGHGHR